MDRLYRITRTATLLAIGVSVYDAAPAVASEGGLILLPDFSGTMPLLIVLFGLMVFPVNALILKPIFRVLDGREEKITGTRRNAERLAGEADEVLQRYENAVREVHVEAERDRKLALERARSEGATTNVGARGEAEQQVQRARDEMATALVDARDTLRSQSKDLARGIASRVLGREFS
jgi:F-type H+-transporting ATPase subunit b